LAKTHRAKNVKERVQQTVQWCRDESPTQYPVHVRWVPELTCKSQATSVRRGRRFNIELSWKRLRGSWSLSNDAVMHEWAHCAVWQEHRDLGDHPPEFWIEYGRLYGLWFDEGGAEDSRDLPVRRVRIR